MAAVSTQRPRPPPQPSPACGGGSRAGSPSPTCGGGRGPPRSGGRVGATFDRTTLWRLHAERAYRGAACRLRFVHVFDDERGVFELARGDRPHDVGQREFADALLQVERRDVAIVALLGIGSV